MKILFARTFAIALVLVLTATGLWAAGAEEAPAAAAEKKYVTDPTTGKVVVAPEYGGTFTFAHQTLSGIFDSVVQGRWASGYHGLVLDKPALADWGRDRDEFALNLPWPTLPYLRGALVESWEQTDDLTIIFHIRKGVHWHDKEPMSGREFTADDIVFNYHRILGLGSGFTEPTPQRTAQLLPIKVESVRATDKYTVVFKLKEPNIKALQGIVDDEVAYIHPPEVIKEHGDTTDWRNLVGTGPYELTDYVEGSSITYTKNPDYWGYDEKYPENRLPYFDQIKGLALPEVATMLSALRTRKIDFLSYAIRSIDQVESLQRTNPEIQMFTHYTRSNETFGMNVQKPPFGDIRVRKAMQMALDLETANTTFFKGWAEMTPYGQNRGPGLHVPFKEWPEEVKKVFTYDPEGAEALLDEAGLPRGSDGIRFKTVMTFNQSYNVAYGELCAAYWRDIGVEVELDVLPGAVQNQRRGDRDYEMMTTEAAFLNPPLSQRFYSGFHHNTANPQDPWYDAAYEALAKAKSFAEFEEMEREMDMYAIEKFWHIWGGMAPQILTSQPWVIGYNGELALGAGQYRLSWSRMWFDSALKEAMGY